MTPTTHLARPVRLVATGLIGCALLVTALVVPAGATSATAAAGPTIVAARRAPARVEVVLNKRTTSELLSKDNRVEGRGGARTMLARKEIHVFLRYRRQGRLRGIKALVGRLALTGGEGPDVVVRRLQVDFQRRRITAVGARDERYSLLQLISLHGPTSGGSGFDADTALILTERGARVLNLAVGEPQPFAPGDLVATAEGLAR